MDSMLFLVQGSAAAPYKVTFHKEGNKFSAFCTCLAGENGQFCKHRTAILENILTGIVSGNEDQVSVVIGWLEGTPTKKALEAVTAAGLEVDRAKGALIKAKKNLALAVRP